MNGLTETEDRMRENIEGALFTIIAGKFGTDSARMYVNEGNVARALDQVSDIEDRHTRTVAALQAVLAEFETWIKEKRDWQKKHKQQRKRRG